MRRPSRELREVLERASRLPEADLLDLYERLVAELDVQPLGEPRRNRCLRERAETLRAMKSARDELALELGTASGLTARAFSDVCQRRIGGWNASRVIRLGKVAGCG